MAGEGLVSMKPTSIAFAGTNAAINANGGVDFTAVTSLSLDGVFTADHDNYVVYITHEAAMSGYNLWYRLRASGTDATATDYVRQNLAAQSTSVSAARNSSVARGNIGLTSTAQFGDTLHVYGPYLAQPTASRSVTGSGHLGAYISDEACTHSLSTSYDGITIFPDTVDITGTVHVFGYEE